MEIDRINQRQNDPAVTGQAPTRRTERTAGEGQPKADPEIVRSPSDTVEISPESRRLARIHQAVNDAPDVRADRVAEIKQRIEDGTYSVSPELLARKLLGDADSQD
jgi:negative regulator of flagellin synthesis FlgM